MGLDLIKRIQSDGADTISFVTHSMGALVVRSIYKHIDSLAGFPFIKRIVMIAPPNNGTQVADFYYKFRFLRYFLGPNLRNLTTDSILGAGKYPIPTCEVGLITGSLNIIKCTSANISKATGTQSGGYAFVPPVA